MSTERQFITIQQVKVQDSVGCTPFPAHDIPDSAISVLEHLGQKLLLEQHHPEHIQKD